MHATLLMSVLRCCVILTAQKVKCLLCCANQDILHPGSQEHLGRPGSCTGAGVVACCCIGLGVQRLRDVCAFALSIKAPAVVGAHECAVRWLYAALCMAGNQKSTKQL